MKAFLMDPYLPIYMLMFSFALISVSYIIETLTLVNKRKEKRPEAAKHVCRAATQRYYMNIVLDPTPRKKRRAR